MPLSMGQVFQLFQYILSAVDQFGALFDEVMAPLGHRCVNGAWYGEHLFAQVQGLFGGDQ